MGTKNFSNANDLITFSRSSAGTALRKIAYGSELVTNGDFSTDSDWTKGSGWSISGGVAVSNNASGFTDIKQSVDVTPNKIYRLDFSVASYTSGAVVPYLGNNGSADATPYDQGNLTNSFRATSAGEFYAFFVFDASQPGQIVLRANSGFIGTIDNVSVKEVLFDDASGDLTLFNHPADVPRIEYDADGNVLGLLVEESRTNLVTYSEDITQWSTTNAPTVTSNIATAPDGTSTVDGVQSETGGAYRRVKPYNSTCTPNGTYTGSVFVKKETSETNYGGVVLNFTGGTAKACYGIIDAVAGTITAPSSGNTITATYSAVDIGDFWRFSITATDDGSNTSLEFGIYGTLSDDGVSLADSTGSVRKIWGAQLEAGAFPTSYIPTSGATATRAADVASIPVSAFGYNQKAGTIIFDVSSINGAVLSALGDGTFNNDLRFGVSGSNTVRGSGAGFVKLVTNGSYSYDTGKIAISIKEDNYYTAKNGVGAGVADTSASLPPNPVNIYIGQDYGNYINGHIKSLRYIPRRLTNDQLVEITT